MGDRDLWKHALSRNSAGYVGEYTQNRVHNASSRPVPLQTVSISKLLFTYKIRTQVSTVFNFRISKDFKAQEDTTCHI